MAIQNQPANLNQLNVISFQTNFLRMPMVDYFCQRVSIPGITSSSIVQTTPFADVPIEGDHLVFEDLSLDFIVDEDLKNYIEIFDWLKAIGFPDNFGQYNSQEEELKSDIFPVALGAINFDTNATSLEPIVVNAIFRYTGAFTIEKIT